MSKKKIDKYVAGWHPNKNVGGIKFHLSDGTQKEIKTKSAAEFSAILSILVSADEPFLTPNGWISTGRDEPGIF